MPMRTGRQRFGAGWLLGVLLAVLEVLRSGVPSGSIHWGLALVTVGLYPLLAGAVALVVSTPPSLRRAVPLAAMLSAVVLFPWLVLVVFPYISLAALSSPAQWPRVGALLVGCLLVGAEVGRRCGARGTLTPRPVVALVLGGVLTAAGSVLLLPRSAPPEPPQASGEGPNVLLVTLDTVRHDALGCYAGVDRRTPTLDSLAASGTRFTAATSAAPWTLASVSSLMTGLYPSTTGVFTGRNRLAEEATTLAEVFAAHGYHTHAIVTNAWLRSDFGIAQGFATYDHRASSPPPPALYSFVAFRLYKRLAPRPPTPPESATDVVDRALRFLDSPPSPFFLWLHFNDAHDPYSPPRRYLPREASFRGQFFANSGRILRLREGNRISSNDRARIRVLYESEVAYIDDSLRRLFSGVRDKSLASRTLVAVTADHGEEFWEHGSVGHGHTLHGELLNVPLILSWPSVIPQGGVVHAPASLVDLFPTLLDHAGIPSPGVHGVSLAQAPPEIRPRFGEALEFFWEQKTVQLDRWKLISEPESARRRLYDVVDDPEERFDLIRQHPLVAAAMESTLSASLARFRTEGDRLRITGRSSTMVLTPALREQLRAQGYLE